MNNGKIARPTVYTSRIGKRFLDRLRPETVFPNHSLRCVRRPRWSSIMGLIDGCCGRVQMICLEVL
jgi:hypothetical protein